MRNQVARPPTVTVTSQHPPTGDEPIEFYYEDCAELTNARVPKKTESRAAWIRRMATPRQHATTQSKPQASDRSQTVATRPFLHDGAMNRTHLNLFSWYPEITNVHPSKPSVQSSSSTSSSSSNLKPSRDCVLVDAHNGLTSFRHRSFPHAVPTPASTRTPARACTPSATSHRPVPARRRPASPSTASPREARSLRRCTPIRVRQSTESRTTRARTMTTVTARRQEKTPQRVTMTMSTSPST